MIGPVERSLRTRMGDGVGLTRSEAQRLGGGVAVVLWDRLLKCGATEEQPDGRRTLRVFTPDPAVAAAQAEAREQRRRAHDEAVAREVRFRAERDAAAQRDREHRSLVVGLEAYAQAERKLVLAERMAALREGGA